LSRRPIARAINRPRGITSRATSGTAGDRREDGKKDHTRPDHIGEVEVWRADDRVWPLCLDDWAQVRGGGGKTWAWAKPGAVALRFIPASGAPGRAIAIALRGRACAVANGVRLGRKPKLTDHQKREAIKRRDHGEETLAEIGRSYNVSG
jgi:hypothetical protein